MSFRTGSGPLDRHPRHLTLPIKKKRKSLFIPRLASCEKTLRWTAGITSADPNCANSGGSIALITWLLTRGRSTVAANTLKKIYRDKRPAGRGWPGWPRWPFSALAFLRTEELKWSWTPALHTGSFWPSVVAAAAFIRRNLFFFFF